LTFFFSPHFISKEFGELCQTCYNVSCLHFKNSVSLLLKDVENNEHIVPIDYMYHKSDINSEPSYGTHFIRNLDIILEDIKNYTSASDDSISKLRDHIINYKLHNEFDKKGKIIQLSPSNQYVLGFYFKCIFCLLHDKTTLLKGHSKFLDFVGTKISSFNKFYSSHEEQEFYKKFTYGNSNKQIKSIKEKYKSIGINF
jgi:hypothetical protein